VAWEKPAPALVERFDASLPPEPTVERRKMFGCPCAFVNGNMFAGVHEQNLILRLDEAGRARARERFGAGPFTAMGRTMHEYVALPGAAQRPPEEVAQLVAEAFGYARSLPAKQARNSGSRQQKGKAQA
jgi:TfoX/Sxy family transcriptional regulator of competence genes